MADRPGRVLEYRGTDIVVEYEPKLCIHAAECVHGLKSVFDPDRKPWLDPDAAEAAEIVQVIERCPTGALRFRPGEAVAAEAAAESNTIRVVPDGPLYLRGRLRIRTADGTETEAHRVALCRCGASKNKPYCDNTHIECEFEDSGALGDGRLVEIEEAEPQGGPSAGSLVVTVAANGPLLLAGPAELHPADTANGGLMKGDKGALCRCGASEKKPYCDGRHREIGFQAE